MYESLKLITQQHPEHQFYFLFDRPFDKQFVFANNVTPVVVRPPARHPVLWHIWFEISLPKILKKIDPDLFLSPDGFLSLTTNVVSLPVIHDLNFAHNPTDLAKTHAWFYNKYFPQYAAKAKRIATVSEFSKSDISDKYDIDNNKIDVVYNGVSERFSSVTEEIKVRVRQKWTDGKQYLIYVGAIHQRKNIVRMLQAYNQFRGSSESDIKFVLVGNRKWWTPEMENTLQRSKFKSDVIFTGRVSDHDLQLLVGSAMANVYVSTFEGFGIPIIESFQAQVPVITSNVTSMPEIAGDAALTVDPFSYEAIAEAMRRMYADEELRVDLAKRGTARASEFNWQRTSDLLWNSIEKTLN